MKTMKAVDFTKRIYRNTLVDIAVSTIQLLSFIVINAKNGFAMVAEILLEGEQDLFGVC